MISKNGHVSQNDTPVRLSPVFPDFTKVEMFDKNTHYPEDADIISSYTFKNKFNIWHE